MFGPRLVLVGVVTTLKGRAIVRPLSHLVPNPQSHRFENHGVKRSGNNTSKTVSQRKSLLFVVWSFQACVRRCSHIPLGSFWTPAMPFTWHLPDHTSAASLEAGCLPDFNFLEDTLLTVFTAEPQISARDRYLKGQHSPRHSPHLWFLECPCPPMPVLSSRAWPEEFKFIGCLRSTRLLLLWHAAKAGLNEVTPSDIWEEECALYRI